MCADWISKHICVLKYLSFPYGKHLKFWEYSTLCFSAVTLMCNTRVPYAGLTQSPLISCISFSLSSCPWLLVTTAHSIFPWHRLPFTLHEWATQSCLPGPRISFSLTTPSFNHSANHEILFFFLWPNRSPLCMHTAFSLPILPVIDMKFVSVSWLLWAVQLSRSLELTVLQDVPEL